MATWSLFTFPYPISLLKECLFPSGAVRIRTLWLDNPNCLYLLLYSFFLGFLSFTFIEPFWLSLK